MTWDIGVINSLRNGGRCFDHVSQFGLSCCQLVSWDLSQCTREVADVVRAESKKSGVRIAAMWSGVPGPADWNFRLGPATLGLVPTQYRWARIEALKQWADFATWIGAPAIITHAGFLPENMTDPDYEGVLVAIRDVARHCKARGIEFWFETGQETPVTLMRYIQAVGTGNLGINLDTANLILYGKGNPIDALDVFGPLVRNIHAKDGFYPTDPFELGREVPVGEGRVRFPEFLQRLKETGFKGDLIIEREISGEQQSRDIRKTVEDLRRWMSALR
jgi:sugar phosphate isomerase/epimerase